MMTTASSVYACHHTYIFIKEAALVRIVVHCEVEEECFIKGREHSGMRDSRSLCSVLIFIMYCILLFHVTFVSNLRFLLILTLMTLADTLYFIGLTCSGISGSIEILNYREVIQHSYHISFRTLWTFETVLVVFRPLNLYVPPGNPFVKELSQGKYLFGIYNYVGSSEPMSTTFLP